MPVPLFLIAVHKRRPNVKVLLLQVPKGNAVPGKKTNVGYSEARSKTAAAVEANGSSAGG
jgi:hypothetical protein